MPGGQDLLTNSAWTPSTVRLCVDGRVLDPAKRRAAALGAQRDMLLAAGVLLGGGWCGAGGASCPGPAASP